MAYSREIVEKAQGIIDERRMKAEDINRQRTAEMMISCPEIYENEMRVRGTFFRLMNEMLTKKISDPGVLERIESDRTAALEFVRKSLREKGYPEDYLDTPYTCPKCRDRGVVEGRRCECMSELLRRLSVESQGGEATVRRFIEARTDIYATPQDREHMKKLIDYLKRYCDDVAQSKASRSLLFHGSTGTGKTFLSQCIASELRERGFAVCFGTAYEFFKAIEDQRFKNADGDTENTMLSCDLLIIDDLGAEFRTSYTESVLYNIINTRTEHARQTIISTNLSIDELRKRYNERISSRLTGTFTTIPFPGNDIRLRLQSV